MVEYDRTQHREQFEKSALKICVVGIGGAGSNVIDRITTDRTVDATLVSVQTDVRVLHHSLAPKKIQLGAELMRGVGAGGDPDLGREAALFSKEQIREAVEGHDMVFISVGLGGGTGSGAAPVVAEIAKSTGATVLVFAAVPFAFEGRRRTTQAREALERLQKSADALVLFENKRMGELLLPKDGIQKAFILADTLISQSVRAVTTMLSSPGLVKLGLADLTAALRVADGRCLFGFGESKGQNRGTEALKRALKSPLINQGHLLQHSKNLLVHIVGGETLTISEVEVIMKQLGRHVPDDTHILFGLGVDPKLGESLSVTLISALSASQLDSLSIEEAEELAPVPERKSPAPRAAPAPKPVETPELFASNHELAPQEEAEPVAPKPVSRATAMKAAVASVSPPPPELFEAIEPEPAPVLKAAPPPKAKPVVAPVPEPQQAEVEIVDEVQSYEVVYSREAAQLEEEEPEEVIPYAPPAQVRKPAAAGIKLSQVIGIGQPPAPIQDSRPVVPEVVDQFEEPEFVEDEIEELDAPIAETQKITAPEPEPTPVPVHRPVTTVRTRSVETVVPVAKQSEAATENKLFEPATTSLQASVRKQALVPPTAVEQQTFSLGQEDRGRFKDTEPAIVQGEDLDVPTWMRMRKKLRR